jgi:putative transposase
MMNDSDVSNEEWELIKHYFDPVDKRGGAGLKHAKRDVVNAIFYLNKTGAQWRLLPKEFPPWQTVYDHYSQ